MNIGSFLHHGQALYGVFKDETVNPASDALRAIYRMRRPRPIDFADSGSV